jgi:hypothetical protein
MEISALIAQKILAALAFILVVVEAFHVKRRQRRLQNNLLND